MRLFIVLLLVGLHLCACQEDKRVKEVDAFFTMEDFGPAIRLKGEILPMDSIWKPARIRVVAGKRTGRTYVLLVYAV